MKILKNTLTILLIAFISINLNAQEVVKSKKEKRKEKKALKKQKNKIQYNKSLQKGSCTSGDCENSSGTFTYSDKSRYEGYWTNDLRHGNGQFYDENGKLTKDGYWENDVFQGSGCIYGDCENGFGTAIYRYGDKYIGNWKEGKQNGQGTWVNPDKSKTAGNWKEGFQDGIFELSDSNGNFIRKETWVKGEGLLKSICKSGDCEDGWGTYTWEDGNKYEGNWKNGVRNDAGNMYWSNGDTYFGNWKNNQRDGIGTYVWNNDGSYYKGEWENEKMNGKGRYYSKDRNLIKTGTWIDNAYQVGETGCILGNCENGKGTYLWENGQKYEGDWKDGKMEGTGVLYLENGIVFHDGQWKNHVKVD